jgi:hypothetical protein
VLQVRTNRRELLREHSLIRLIVFNTNCCEPKLGHLPKLRTAPYKTPPESMEINDDRILAYRLT